MHNETLFEACRNLDITEVRKAIANGANPNVTTADSTSALGITLLESNEGISVSDSNLDGLTPEIKQKVRDITEILLQAGANPETLQTLKSLQEINNSENATVQEDSTKTTHACALNGLDQALKLILEKGANPNASNDMKITPLHVAANCCEHACITILLNHQADPTLQNQTGEIPLETCLKSRIWKHIRENGSTTAQNQINRQATLCIQALLEKTSKLSHQKMQDILKACAGTPPETQACISTWVAENWTPKQPTN